MNVLSGFDGMSCGRIALEKAGISVKNYYASEIDKFAISVSNNNWKDIIQLGNIINWKDWNLDWSSIDLVIGGSPCQGFSFIGKQLAFDDPRSMLFFVWVDIYNHIKTKNPNVKFILENVRMKRDFKDAISNLLDVEPIEINSSLVSAQSRRRLYWSNINGINQPEDKNIHLQDIISKGDEKYFLKGKRLLNWERNFEMRIKKKFSSLDSEKAICMTARQFANWYGNHVTENGRIRQLTPMECERLQNVPDNYTDCVSDSQRYKMLGNGWTIDVIVYILSFL